jgi:hypothetical protein
MEFSRTNYGEIKYKDVFGEKSELRRRRDDLDFGVNSTALKDGNEATNAGLPRFRSKRIPPLSFFGMN